ncbi:Sulfur carrier protein ThiS adenylyltransferase [Vibrio aerogenes CECT 7868]|uniref:Sulfur carrier protein ThiS adenylyltransferase n=2 Tax=Vibrio aerogenes TaxID=92172 RepID=A0A1M5ZIH5_9VIBR|nr:Sulfur carrier protein ThiS adenylyltransferase [Vibrio aerogenes CECT 7868]
MQSMTDADFIRYQRQIALPEIGESGQRKINHSTVLIIGCGGLGTTASLLLAGAGVGSLVIVDDDKVEISNLHRQFIYTESDIGRQKAEALKEKIRMRNQHCRVRAIEKRLGDEQLSLEVMIADMVIDCSDNMVTRHQINRICYQQKTVLISGSASQWEGQISTYNFAANQPCFACLTPDKSGSTDELSDESPALSCRDLGVIGPVVSIIASLQAMAALKQMVDIGIADESQTNTLHILNGQTMSFRSFSFHKNPECRVCHQSQEKETVHANQD